MVHLVYVPKTNELAIVTIGFLGILVTTEMDGQMLDTIDSRNFFKKNKDAFILDQLEE